MAVGSIGLLALVFSQELTLNRLVDQTGNQRLVGKTFFEGLSLDAKQIMTAQAHVDPSVFLECILRSPLQIGEEFTGGPSQAR